MSPEEFSCDLSLRHSRFLTGAGERNRTAVISLEGGTHSKHIKRLSAKLRFLRPKCVNGLGVSYKTFPRSALPSNADMCGATRGVHFGPIADIGLTFSRPQSDSQFQAR